MANYLLVMLSPSAMNWLLSLPADSIDSWPDLKSKFVENYKATCRQPASKHDLARIFQKPGESLRSYIRHFSELRNSVTNISEVEVVTAFSRGILHSHELRQKFNRKPPTRIDEMLQMANQYANAEDAEERYKDDFACFSRQDRPDRRNDR